MDPASELILLGVVVGAHGIGGEVRVRPFNPESTALRTVTHLRLRDAQGGVRILRVARSRPHKRLLLFKLEGIEDRSAAQAARGLEVLVPRAELQATEEDEFYYLDLLGMQVESEAGGSLGEVVEILETGSNVVLVVRRPGRSRGRLLPFIEDAVVRVDLEARRLVVRPEACVEES